jgi:ankyrin repeat protein
MDAYLSQKIEIRQERKTALLRTAVEKGDEHGLLVLLLKGVDMDAKLAKGGERALHLAAGLGHAKLVRLLLEEEVDLDAQDAEGRTPLMDACIAGRLEIAGLLLDEGADAKAQDAEKKSALDHLRAAKPDPDAAPERAKAFDALIERLGKSAKGGD